MKKLFFLLSLFLYGCGTSGPTYLQMAEQIPQISEDNYRIFFMRTDNFEYAGRDAPIEMNDEDAGDLPNGGFFYKDVNFQKVAIATSLWDVFGSSSLQFETEKGQTYYVLVTPREASVEAALTGGILGTVYESMNKKQGGAFALNLVNEESAKKILNELEYVEDP